MKPQPTGCGNEGSTIDPSNTNACAVVCEVMCSGRAAESLGCVRILEHERRHSPVFQSGIRVLCHLDSHRAPENQGTLSGFNWHPSGDPTPSEADIKITRDLI